MPGEPNVIVAAAAPIPSDPSPIRSDGPKVKSIQGPVKGNLFEYDAEEGEEDDGDALVFDREENLSTADQKMNPGMQQK